jgi:hypothetical protein
MSKSNSNTITTKDDTKIYYKDWGKGPVVLFSHGWPLNSDAWDGQMFFLADKGFRVVAHDRRGHGRSSQPSLGNDMDGLCRRSCSCDRGPRSEWGHPRGPFYWRRRSCPLHRAPRYEEGCQNGPRCRSPADYAEIGCESRGGSQSRCSTTYLKYNQCLLDSFLRKFYFYASFLANAYFITLIVIDRNNL